MQNWEKIEVEVTGIEKEQLELLASKSKMNIERYLKTIIRVHLNKEKNFIQYLRQEQKGK
jgi:HSP20 family molecular chaperone IbpA